MADRVPAVLGLDVGTTEAKAALIGLDGRLLGQGRGSYPTDAAADGQAEQDPRDWWAALSTAVRAIDVAAGEVVAICGVAQGPTLVAVDAAVPSVRRSRGRTGGPAGPGSGCSRRWPGSPAKTRQLRRAQRGCSQRGMRWGCG